ncbi:hypothetical protein [Cytobacillus firmus]|uniref:hypothetical protein n=1 Tax=Cytobacillus firmus TaxID=1399 RepID=UPI00300162E2
MENEELLEQLEHHKSEITTAAHWNSYAKRAGLPDSNRLIANYGSWNKLKRMLGLPVTNTSYTPIEIRKIVKKHKNYVRTQSVWDLYAREHSLPSSKTLIKSFGTWSEVRKYVGNKRERKPTYTKKEIKDILKNHAPNFQNRTQWDVYAKENKLPTYKTIKKFFDYEEITRILNKEKKINLSKDDLRRIALKHKDVFLASSMAKWDIYAFENNLPRSSTFHKHFGSWNKSKNEIKPM